MCIVFTSKNSDKADSEDLSSSNSRLGCSEQRERSLVLPEPLPCARHIHGAAPLSVTEASSLLPLSHPQNGKTCQALSILPRWLWNHALLSTRTKAQLRSYHSCLDCCLNPTLPSQLALYRALRVAHQSLWSDHISPLWRALSGPQQHLENVQIPQQCPAALGDQPLPTSPESCASGLPTPSHHWVSLRVTGVGAVLCLLLMLLWRSLSPSCSLAGSRLPTCITDSPLCLATSALSTLHPSQAGPSPSGPTLPGHSGLSSSVSMNASPIFC